MHAQIEITWGLPMKHPRKTYIGDIIGTDDQAIYTIRYSASVFSSSAPTLERYKKSDLSLEYTKPIPCKRADGRHFQPSAIYFVNGKILCFASYYERETMEIKAYGQILEANGAVSKSWIEIGKLKSEKKSQQGSFLFTISNDSASVLLIGNPPYDSYGDEKFEFSLIDNQFNFLWKKQVSLPYRDKYFTLNSFMVKENGNVYMLANISKDKSNMSFRERRTTPTYYYNILMYEHATDQLTEFPVDLKEKFITDVSFNVLGNGNIICAGFYSNKNSVNIIGTFYMQMDHQSKSVITQNVKEFDQDFLTQFMSAKKASKGRELYSYDFRHFIIREDGGAVIVAEQFYITQHCTTDPRTGATSCTYYYHYNDIIVISINPNGQIDWAKKIAKRQVTANDGGYFSSFAMAVSGNKLYFMFNDNPKNMLNDGKGIRTMGSAKKSMAVLVTLDSNGNQTREAMFSNKDLKIILRPKLFLQTTEQEMILYGQKGKTYKLATVKIGT
ncbi:MAG: hypothetical protein Fur0041_11160 [Bacteroidia bacterium]